MGVGIAGANGLPTGKGVTLPLADDGMQSISRSSGGWGNLIQMQKEAVGLNKGTRGQLVGPGLDPPIDTPSLDTVGIDKHLAGGGRKKAGISGPVGVVNNAGLMLTCMCWTRRDRGILAGTGTGLHASCPSGGGVPGTGWHPWTATPCCTRSCAVSIACWC